MKKLHVGARWIFRVRAYMALVFLSFFLGWFVIPALAILFLILSGGSNVSILQVLLAVLAYIVLAILLGEIYARMAYNRWFYEFKESGMKLERGIIWKRYSNVPYERIQNVDVHRGILARLIGFSSVYVQTAGFSGVAGAEGNIPAVEIGEAEKIREFLLKKLRGRHG
jgi:uncharacterized protein